MQSTHTQPAAAVADAMARAPADRPSHAAMLLQVIASGGYGLWLWLGLSLLLGLSPRGRSGILVPLALGSELVGLGLLLAVLRVPGLASWHGWLPRPYHRPSRSALMALATWLPVLAVAGLAQGNNTFWITRLAGALLMLCSLVSLLRVTHDDRDRLPAPLQRATALLPACRITMAAFSGGLWLWLSMSVQDKFGSDHGAHLWILLLLALALGLGLLESALWQSLREPEALAGETVINRGRFAMRLVAGTLTYAFPCTALLISGLTGNLPAATLAAPACALGLLLERHLYESAVAAMTYPKRI